MPRRRRPGPDTRLSWRDPEMPLLKRWEWPSGQIGLREIPPEEEQDYRLEKIALQEPGRPEWRRDETYALRQRRGARNVDEIVERAMERSAACTSTTPRAATPAPTPGSSP